MRLYCFLLHGRRQPRVSAARGPRCISIEKRTGESAEQDTVAHLAEALGVSLEPALNCLFTCVQDFVGSDSSELV